MRQPPSLSLDAFARESGRSGQLALLKRFIDTMPVLQNWPQRAEGVPIGLVDDTPVFLPLEGHSLTIGSSGEGKFSSVIAPLALHDILDAKGLAAGMVFIDAKNGEAARITAPYRRTLREEQVFVIDPYNKAGGTDSLNPFDFIDPSSEDFFESCQGFARALIVQRPAGKRGNDFIWDSKGAEWLTGMIAHLVLDPTESRTLRRLRSIFAVEEEEFGAVLKAMKANPASPSWVRDMADDMSRVTRKAEREASGYIATIREATQFVDSSMMARVLDQSTFDPKVVKSHGATVYIVSDENYLTQSAPWVRLMSEIVRQRIARSAVDRAVHWVVDEAKAFDAWSFIADGLRAMRSGRVSLHLFYQNIGQMKAVWGEGWSSITDVRVIRFLGSSDVETLKWIADMTGEIAVVDYSQAMNESESTNLTQSEGSTSSTAKGHSTSSGRSKSVAEGSTQSSTKGGSHARGSNWSRGTTSSESLTTTNGLSITRGNSTSVTESTGVSIGDSKQQTSAWPNTSYSTGSSTGATASTAYGSAQTYSETESNSTTRAAQNGRSSSTGGSKTDSETWSDGDSKSRTDTAGTTESEAATDTQTEGLSKGSSTAKGNSTGKTITRTERRRIMTVDEVRRMPNATLLFVERRPECLVDRMHYHKLAPLVARVLEGQIAFGPPDD
jgi:type IV secretion system protein VirD4